jgi:hypothetical protein
MKLQLDHGHKNMHNKIIVFHTIKKLKFKKKKNIFI